MNPLLFMKTASSIKTEVIIVICVVVGLFFMPLVVIASAGNLASLAVHELFDGPVVASDTYDYGYCTYWAALRRMQVGHPIPNSWGNANTWGIRAAADGYVVDHTPSVGAIMQTDAYEWGHVAYVESVNSSNGSWTISEMNWIGWDEVDNRTLPSVEDLFYYFIH